MGNSPGFIDELRNAVQASGYGLRELCRGAGMDPSALSRFLNGERGLSMTNIDKLAAFLGLHVTGPTTTEDEPAKGTTKRAASKAKKDTRTKKAKGTKQSRKG